MYQTSNIIPVKLISKLYFKPLRQTKDQDHISTTNQGYITNYRIESAKKN